MSDAVNHPQHYNSHPSGIECIEIARHHNFTIGSAFKYLWRAGLKGTETAIEDLRKAIWCIEDEIRQLEKKQAEVPQEFELFLLFGPEFRFKRTLKAQDSHTISQVTEIAVTAVKNYPFGYSDDPYALSLKTGTGAFRVLKSTATLSELGIRPGTEVFLVRLPHEAAA